MGKTFFDEISIAEQATTPSLPPSGFQYVYPKSNGKLYALNASGVETAITGEGSLTYIINGGGVAITTGLKDFVEVPFDCIVVGWSIVADVSGSIVVDVWKDTYANFPPTVAVTIAGTEKPTLSSAQKNQDLTLSTWTPTLTKGDWLAYNVDSASTVTKVTITLRVLKI